MNQEILYSVDYIRRAIAAETLEAPSERLAGRENFEALISLQIAHKGGGAQSARLAWHSLIAAQRPELARAFGMLRHLYSVEQLASIPRMRYAVEGYPIYENAFNLLVGERGTGKSFFGIDIASRYAQLGKRVLYIAAEGVETYNPRALAWHDHHNLEFVPGNMFFWEQAVNTANKKQFNEWVQWIVKPFEPKMIIVDTVARCMVDMDENSSSDMKRFVAAWDELRQSGITMLLIHHTNRAGFQRGSGVLDDAADSVLMLRRMDGTIAVRNDYEGGGKNKGSAEAAPLYFQLEKHEVGEYTGEDAAAVLVKVDKKTIDISEIGNLSESQLQILEAVQGLDEGLTAKELMDMLATSNALYRQLKTLTTAGYLKKQASMYSLTEKGQIAIDSNNNEDHKVRVDLL